MKIPEHIPHSRAIRSKEIGEITSENIDERVSEILSEALKAVKELSQSAKEKGLEVDWENSELHWMHYPNGLPSNDEMGNEIFDPTPQRFVYLRCSALPKEGFNPEQTPSVEV